MLWVAVIGGLVLTVAAYLIGRRQGGRRHVYRALASLRGRLTANLAPVLKPRPGVSEVARSFERERMIYLSDFVADETLEAMRQEVLSVQDQALRSFIPTHKKGGTISYEKIHYIAPRCLAFYHSPAVQSFVSSIVGLDVRPTADHDQSSCSVLVYNEAGDHINWHYDHNFYKGRHFTILLGLVNRSRTGGVSSSELMRKLPTGEELTMSTAENNLVIFEGNQCLHRATQTADGDLRILLSMTYGTTPEISWFMEAMRRVKDTAFYGLKVLWD